MAWFDSLTQKDKTELAAYVERFGGAAFELYLILTLRIALVEPIPAEALYQFIADHGELDWHRIKDEFELRDGLWHIKQSART